MIKTKRQLIIVSAGMVAAAAASLVPFVYALHPRITALQIIITISMGLLGALLGGVFARGYNTIQFKPQQRINRELREEFEKVDNELTALFEDIRSAPLEPEQTNLLNESQAKWQEFREAEAQYHASEVKGGTMWPALYFTTMLELSNERLAHLRRLKDYVDAWHRNPTEQDVQEQSFDE